MAAQVGDRQKQTVFTNGRPVIRTQASAAETAMNDYDPSEQECSDTNGSTESKIDGDEYLTTVNGRVGLLASSPLNEVIQVFAEKGLGTWFQITEVRDDDRLTEYDTEAVYAVIEFLKELGVVNEDVDRSVCMEDTYQNRALVTKFTQEDRQ